MTVDWREAYEREQRRAHTDRAIVEAKLPPNLETLAHWINRCVDDHGAIWKGAERLAGELGWSATWVYILLERLCSRGVAEQIERGGGCHRTSTYVLKIGHWRLDARNPHMQDDWAQRCRAVRAKVLDYVYDLFWTHHEQHKCNGKCWRFAPKELKQPPIDWAPT